MSNIIKRHEDLLNAPEQTYVAKDRRVPWRQEKVRKETEEALNGDTLEKLDDDEITLYQKAYAAAKARYTEENSSAYTSAYDKAKERHSSVMPERRFWGPGPGMITYHRHPLATSVTGRPASRSPSPAKPEEIPSLSRTAVQWQGNASEAMSPETKKAISAAASSLHRSVFDITEARFAREGEYVPRSPETKGAVSSTPNTGSWRDYIV